MELPADSAGSDPAEMTPGFVSRLEAARAVLDIVIGATWDFLLFDGWKRARSDQ